MKYVITTLIFLSTVAQATDCMVTTDRKPCPGKDTEALKPYNMVNPKTETDKKAKDEASCKANAEKSAKIVRRDILVNKSVTAVFGDKKFGPFTDTSDCKK